MKPIALRGSTSTTTNRTDVAWTAKSTQFAPAIGQQMSEWTGATPSVSTISLRGPFFGVPDVVTRGRDKFDIVGVGKDNAAIHASFSNGVWSPSTDPQDWTNLGENFVTPLTITSLTQARFDVFGVNSSHVIAHKSKEDSDNVWSDWEYLSGHWHSAVSAANRWVDALDLVVLDPKLRMCYKLWEGGDPHPWEVLGGEFISCPVVIPLGQDQVHVFGLDSKKRILHKVGKCVGKDTPLWTPPGQEWTTIGEGFDSVPSGTCFLPDRLDLFAVKQNEELFRNYWSNGSWSGWVTTTAKLCKTAPLALAKGGRWMQVFVATDAGLWVQNISATDMGGWRQLNKEANLDPTLKGSPPYFSEIW